MVYVGWLQVQDPWMWRPGVWPRRRGGASWRWGWATGRWSALRPSALSPRLSSSAAPACCSSHRAASSPASSRVSYPLLIPNSRIFHKVIIMMIDYLNSDGYPAWRQLRGLPHLPKWRQLLNDYHLRPGLGELSRKRVCTVWSSSFLRVRLLYSQDAQRRAQTSHVCQVSLIMICVICVCCYAVEVSYED